MTEEVAFCKICNRLLNTEDPKSLDCGGDCWGCMSEIEGHGTETRVVNKYKEDYDVYIGRGSKWGNPYSHLPSSYPDVVLVESRELAIELFEVYLLTNENLVNDLGELRGKTLGCFCKPQACHGDVLVKYAEMV